MKLSRLYFAVSFIFLIACADKSEYALEVELRGNDSQNINLSDDQNFVSLYQYSPVMKPIMVPSVDFYNPTIYSHLLRNYNSIPHWMSETKYQEKNGTKFFSLVPIIDLDSREVWGSIIIHAIPEENRYEYNILSKLGRRSNSYIQGYFTEWVIVGGPNGEYEMYTDVTVSYSWVHDCTNSKDDGFPWEDWPGSGSVGSNSNDYPPFDPWIEWPEPCWTDVLGEHSNESVYYEDWCDKYSGFNFGDFEREGWFLNSDSYEFINEDWRYLEDPTNSNYVIDMRHFLFIGFYLEMTTSTGNALGDAVELGQLLSGHTNSALNWQDFFSNRLGSAFARFLMMRDDIAWESGETNLGDLICQFVNDPLYLNLRPIPNPEKC